jgi:predicted ATPase
MSLPVREFKARNYRSLKAIAYPVSDLDVFIGANGAGKTNLYRALELLQSAAANTLARDLAQEGGLDSTLWAGPRRRDEAARLELSVGLAQKNRGPRRSLLRYQVAIGYPPREVNEFGEWVPTTAAFLNEPQIKEEHVGLVGGTRTLRLMDRKNQAVMARDDTGRPTQIDIDLLHSETVLGRLEDPGRYPELDEVRRTLLQWRFYHNLRSDAGSPLRHPSPPVATLTLASDGSDLAAVFATLVHIRQDTVDLDAAIEAAFPGARLVVPQPGRMASFGMSFPEFPQRIFEAPELSDGTLRFLALTGALLAYRLPPFIALNEPEASLHPDLMEPLAQLIVRAAERTQVWLVTHSTRLAEAITATGAGKARTVVKHDGATQIEGLKMWGAFDEGDED